MDIKKKAAEEIVEILKKHNLRGFGVFVEETSGTFDAAAFLHKMNPHHMLNAIKTLIQETPFGDDIVKAVMDTIISGQEIEGMKIMKFDLPTNNEDIN